MTQAVASRPELILGLVGPIGCGIDKVQQCLESAFKEVDYQCHTISVSKAIEELLEAIDGKPNELKTLQEKIDAGNRVRCHYKKNGVLAAHTINSIREARRKINLSRQAKYSDENELYSKSEGSTVYIIRQLKRPEELELLGKVYGKRFLQVSITEPKNQRITNLIRRIRKDSRDIPEENLEVHARKLVDRDEVEDNDFGQRLTEIFHRADVFIDTSDDKQIDAMTRRFVRALFGKNDIAPTKDEFGSYMAKSASLRSVDLSRQVGAAIISKEGDLITIGCNEVPKPGGGNYWDEDGEKRRDIDIGGEANKEITSRIIYDLLAVLEEGKVLKKGQNPAKIMDNGDTQELLKKAIIGDITEYGRMVHAEMNAITDAARIGRSIQGSTLYVTTFPCHNCAKHIISSGIEKVVFVEPYPKSKAELLYGDLISIDHTDGKGVEFRHFYGMSPRRFRDIFEKGKRRAKDGTILDWYEGKMAPRIGDHENDYTAAELHAINDNLSAYFEKG